MDDSLTDAVLCASLFNADCLDDQTELDERISYLEKKVSLQDDEIQCLKSALADALRRLSDLASKLYTQNVMIFFFFACFFLYILGYFSMIVNVQ